MPIARMLRRVRTGRCLRFSMTSLLIKLLVGYDAGADEAHVSAKCLAASTKRKQPQIPQAPPPRAPEDSWQATDAPSPDRTDCNTGMATATRSLRRASTDG